MVFTCVSHFSHALRNNWPYFSSNDSERQAIADNAEEDKAKTREKTGKTKTRTNPALRILSFPNDSRGGPIKAPP